MRGLGISIIVASSCVWMASCANLQSISHTKRMGGNGFVHMTDAKQRGIISQRFTETFEQADGARVTQNYFRFCSEPPPDVFTALGVAAAAELQKTPSADGTSLGANLALAIAENASTIERTQTINLLRLSMYSTCERYLNGALTQEEFVIQAARDQRAMVAVLAIEQLTGVVRPQPTIIAAGGQAFLASKPDEVIASLDTAQKEATKAQEEYEAAEKAKAEHVALKDCESAPAADTSSDTTNSNGDTSESEKSEDENSDSSANPPAGSDDLAGEAASAAAAVASDNSTPSCKTEASVKALDDKLEAAKAKRDDKASHYAAVKTVATSDAAGLGAIANAPDGFTPAHVKQAEAASTIADTVVKIVDRTFNDASELTFVCMAYLRRSNVRENADLYKQCSRLIGAEIEKEVQKTRALTVAQANAMTVDAADALVSTLSGLTGGLPGSASADAFAKIIDIANLNYDAGIDSYDRRRLLASISREADLRRVIGQLTSSKKAALKSALLSGVY